MNEKLYRLAALREALAAQGVAGFLVPRGDEHLGEYVPKAGERLAWLTGFTGSAGMAVVLPGRAAVFTDGRYTTQLAAETDAALWERRHITEEPPAEWLREHAQGLALGGDIVVGHSQRAVGPAHRAPVGPKARERLRSRHLVDQVQVDV